MEKKMTLSDVGIAMKGEAAKTSGEIMLVSKRLWLEIAELLMVTDRSLEEIEKIAKGMEGKYGK